MNQDAAINRLAHITGKSRKEVIDALRKLSKIPQVKKYLKNGTNDHNGRKKASESFK